MGIASCLNRSLAHVIYDKELTDAQRKLVQEGKTQEVISERNETWTPGLIQWLESYAKAQKHST